MPRKKKEDKKRCKPITEKELTERVEIYKNREGTRNPISKQKACQLDDGRKIPYETFRRWCSGEKQQRFGSGRPTALSKSDEEYLVQAIILFQEYGWPLTEDKLKTIVETFVKIRKLKTPFTGDRPGHDWFLAFRHRWSSQLSMRKPEILTIARAKSTTVEVHKAFMTLVKKAYNELGITDKPAQIWNCDETGINVNATGNESVLVRRGSKEVHLVQPSEGKKQFTVMMCGNAAGEMLPPFVIYKAKKITDTMVVGGPPGAAYCTTDSGWMEKPAMRPFMNFFIEQMENRPKPNLLYMDGHGAHFDAAALQQGYDNEVHAFCIPPNSTHMYQPLDVGYFRQLKGSSRKAVANFYDDTRRSKSITNHNFAPLLKEMLENTDPKKMMNAFRHTGLYPFNPGAVPAHKFAPSQIFDAGENSAVSMNDSSSSSFDVSSLSEGGLSSSASSAVTFSYEITPKTALRISITNVLKPQQSLKVTRPNRIQRPAGTYVTEATIEVLRRKEAEQADKKRKKVANRRQKQKRPKFPRHQLQGWKLPGKLGIVKTVPKKKPMKVAGFVPVLTPRMAEKEK